MKNKVVSLGVFASIFSFAGFMYIPFVAPLIKSALEQGTTYGLPIDVWLGILAAIGPLSIVLGTHMMGSLSDNVGRRKVIICGIAMTLIGISIYLVTDNPFGFVVARAFELLGYATVLMITLAKANDLVKEKNRGRQQGVFLSLAYLGSILGPITGGWITTHYYAKAPFLAAEVIVLILAAYLLTLKKEKFKPTGKSSFSLYENWKKFLGFRKLKGMAILGVTMHAHAPILIFFLPLYILELFPGRYEYIGYAVFALGLFKPFQWIIGKYVDTYGKAKLTLLGTLIVGLSLFMIPLAQNIQSLLAILALFSLGGGMWNTGAWTLMSSIGEANHIEGHIVGSYTSIAKFGDFVASLVLGWVAHLTGYADLFTIGGYIVLVGILCSLFFLRDITALPSHK